METCIVYCILNRITKKNVENDWMKIVNEKLFLFEFVLHLQCVQRDDDMLKLSVTIIEFNDRSYSSELLRTLRLHPDDSLLTIECETHEKMGASIRK